MQPSNVSDRLPIECQLELADWRRVAAALDCDLVYALVPRTTLEEDGARPTRSSAADASIATSHARLKPNASERLSTSRRATTIAIRRLVADGRLWDDRDAD